MKSSRSRFGLLTSLSLFAIACLASFLLSSRIGDLNPQFFLLGVLGAFFANSTGAGGGVIFIPTFQVLNIADSAALATSFAIQTYGMTAGAVSWLLLHYLVDHKEFWKLARTAGVLSLISIAGIWTCIWLGVSSPANLNTSFKLFSLILGLAIIVVATRKRVREPRSAISRVDYFALFLLSYFGGFITYWLSVGVGELIAFYLLFRRFHGRFAVAVAVIVTACTVWSITPLTFDSQSQTVWDIALIAGPGAVIGGYVAKWAVEKLSERKFKVFFGTWLILIAGFG